jgi:hypothetical protein
MVPVEGQVMVFDPQDTSPITWGLGVAGLLLVIALFVWWRMSGETETTAHPDAISIPESLTPTGAALLLRRIEQSQALSWSTSERSELRADIDAIQRRHFANGEVGNGHANVQASGANSLRPTVQRWTTRAAKTG